MTQDLFTIQSTNLYKNETKYEERTEATTQPTITSTTSITAARKNVNVFLFMYIE